MKSETIIRVAAFSAVIAIGAGAFGAHATSGQAAEWLKTGAAYQLPHAAAAIIVSRLDARVSWVLLGGATIFALSLYLMALGAPHWFGAITPLGGAAMIGGWLWLALGRGAAAIRTIDD